MAAATVANRNEFLIGNARMVTADLTIAADADTWDTGLKQVVFGTVHLTVDSSTDSVSVDTTLPSSTGTLTIGMTGSATALRGLAIGF